MCLMKEADQWINFYVFSKTKRIRGFAIMCYIKAHQGLCNYVLYCVTNGVAIATSGHE